MANISHGMNVDEVNDLAHVLAKSAESIQQMAVALNGKVGRTTWVGPDATRFKNQWWPEHGRSLRSVAEALQGFAESARNNATEQRNASEDGGTEAAPVPSQPGTTNPGVITNPDAGGPATPTPGSITPPRDWRDVQKGYDQWAGNGFWSQPDYRYQCTGWAHYRWHELGYSGPAFKGNGWEMAGNAPGEVSSTPSLHAIASYGNGAKGTFGHVMVVEEVAPDGSWIRVSEMNTGRDELVGRPEEYSDSARVTRQPDGSFQRNGQTIRFAAFPG